MRVALQAGSRRAAVLRTLTAAVLAGVACVSSRGAGPATGGAPATAPAAPSAGTVAVLPLAGGTGMEGLGFAISEILARDLALVPRLRVVERARLDAVLREIGLGTTGRIAPGSAPRAGQLVGAERLLTGSVTGSATGASIDVSMVNVQNGATELVYSERLALNGVIDAQERIAERAFQRLGVTLLPAERERLAKRPTRRVDALIAFGNGRRAEALGNIAAARTFYAQAARLDPAFVEAAEALAPSAVPTLAATPLAPPPIRPSAPPAGSVRSPFALLLDDLMLTVTDRVVRSAAPPAVCPPICPALTSVTGTVIVRIRP